MDLRKILFSSSLLIPLSFSTALSDEVRQEVYLRPQESDFRKGVYVDFVESFVPGDYMGEENWKKRIKGVLGKEKVKIGDSLSLGHYGEVIVSYTEGMKKKNNALCFRRNGTIPTLYVHETNSLANRIEPVEVFVTPDKNLDESTKWISLGTKTIEEGEGNWIPFYMSIEEAYHIKLKDAGGKKSNDTIHPGFDASAVLLTKPCRPTS